MTEAEWDTSSDLFQMARAASTRPRASARVFRLYLAAFWREQARRILDPSARQQMEWWVTAVEEWADSGIPPKTGRKLFMYFQAEEAESGFVDTLQGLTERPLARAERQTALWALHELFGNPYATRRKQKGDPRRGWMCAPAWRTETAVTLARQMYESREFSAMPILADALQDAGCDNDDILSHCRGAGPHVRGCWVVDLVLGKT
jgi:hypothetical protein